MTMVFYLKINRDENYSYRNLQRWIDIISLCHEGQVILLCDKEIIVDKASGRIDFRNLKYEWIQSERNDSILRYVTESVIQPDWRMASYAHLTTFWDALKKGFDSFWNIDADDTFFCLSSQRTAELLLAAQQYADDKEIDIFSLDMWRSREPGLQWTFGITYTRTSIDWMDVIQKGCKLDDEKRESIMRLCHNIDLYFTYLGEVGLIKAESFYVENLKYIHYSDDFFRRPMNSGMFHWKNGELIFPLLYYIIGQNKVGKIKIYKDVIKLDIGITDEETTDAIIQSGFDEKRVVWTERMYDCENMGMDKKEIVKEIAENYY